jgi:hypothetical protein
MMKRNGCRFVVTVVLVIRGVCWVLLFLIQLLGHAEKVADLMISVFG